MSLAVQKHFLPVRKVKPFPGNPRFAVEVYRDPVDIGARVAVRVQRLARQGRGTVLTPGCTTPAPNVAGNPNGTGMYQQIALRAPRDFLSLLKGEEGSFSMGMIDGIRFPLSHHLNFRRYFWEQFLRLFGLRDFSRLRNVYVPHLPPDGSPMAMRAEVREFDRWLKARMPIDLIVAGLGVNGHVAFLEPGQATQNGRLAKVVRLSDGTRGWKWVGEDAACYCTRFGACDTLPQAPQHALTITPAVFQEAKEVVVMATGRDKAGVVRQMIEGDDPPEKFPANLLRQARGRVSVYLDEPAASELRLAA